MEKETNTGDILSRLIASLPDDGHDEQPEEAPALPPQIVHNTPRLMECHGWPQKYARPLEAILGAEWAAAFERAKVITARGGILLLHGGRGNGKTRMAAEIARANAYPAGSRVEADPLGGTRKVKERWAVYRRAMDVFLEIRATYNSKTRSEAEVIAALLQPGLLILDEIQERGEKPFEDRIITHLIDKRYSAELPTILIANLSKEELEASLSPSIIDRIFEDGKRLEFTWPSFRRNRQTQRTA